MICELDEQKCGVRLFPVVWISAINQFLVFTSFEKCSFQLFSVSSFILYSVNEHRMFIGNKAFHFPGMNYQSVSYSCEPRGVFCNLLELSFTSCFSHHFSMSILCVNEGPGYMVKFPYCFSKLMEPRSSFKCRRCPSPCKMPVPLSDHPGLFESPV